METPQLLSGARGLIQRTKTDGSTIETLAFATDITINVRAGVQPTFVVGRMNAAGIDTLSYDVDVTVGRVIPVNPSTSQSPDAAAAGWKPYAETGTATTVTEYSASTKMDLEPLIKDMISAGDISISLYDKVTGKYVAAVRGCRFAGRGMGLSAGAIANESLSFVGIYDSGYSSAENSGYVTGYGV